MAKNEEKEIPKIDLNKEDIKMNYRKGDENKDYFEHMDKGDIPK